MSDTVIDRVGGSRVVGLKMPRYCLSVFGQHFDLCLLSDTESVGGSGVGGTQDVSLLLVCLWQYSNLCLSDTDRVGGSRGGEAQDASLVS